MSRNWNPSILPVKVIEYQPAPSSVRVYPCAPPQPVISVGPDVKGIAANDKVVVGNYTGSDIKLDGVDYKFVKLEDVLAVVTD